MGLHPGDAIQFLDSCPEMEFSVWVSCGDDQPEQWRNGFAAVVLDNGIDRAAGEKILINFILPTFQISCLYLLIFIVML